MHSKNRRLFPPTEFGLAYFALLGGLGMLFVSAMTAESLLGPLGPFDQKVYVNHPKPVRVILYGTIWLGLFLVQAFVCLTRLRRLPDHRACVSMVKPGRLLATVGLAALLTWLWFDDLVLGFFVLQPAVLSYRVRLALHILFMLVALVITGFPLYYRWTERPHDPPPVPCSATRSRAKDPH